MTPTRRRTPSTDGDAAAFYRADLTQTGECKCKFPTRMNVLATPFDRFPSCHLRDRFRSVPCRHRIRIRGPNRCRIRVRSHGRKGPINTAYGPPPPCAAAFVIVGAMRESTFGVKPAAIQGEQSGIASEGSAGGTLPPGAPCSDRFGGVPSRWCFSRATGHTAEHSRRPGVRSAFAPPGARESLRRPPLGQPCGNWAGGPQHLHGTRLRGPRMLP